MSRTLRDDRINRILYISLGGVVGLIILFIILFNIFSSQNKKNDNLQIGENNSDDIIEEANSSIGKSVHGSIENREDEENIQVKTADNNHVADNQEDLDNVQNKTENKPVETTETSNNIGEEKKEDNTQKENVPADEKVQDPIFIMPVEGEIVKRYGKEQLIYSDTLKEWTTHLGIDIKADKTTVVKASSDGVVKSIKNDPRFGLTVVLEHQNGFTSVYSNLLTAEFVVQGETVKAGQTLGTVGNSATFEILDDPHLHFEILKDGNSIDPEMYIK
ncbi:MAG: M23 family metallopeptidase [Clostridia bacterium]|nr:M23 family metallopeptidase [Clostridia bacterium]